MKCTSSLPIARRRLLLASSLALAVVAAAVWLSAVEWRTSEAGDPADVGDRSVAEPSCGPVQRQPAGGAGDHIDGAPIAYSSAPPSFGDHRSRWAVRPPRFYDVDDRPEVAVLVHNLEHGYNILWYDETVVDDEIALARVQEIAAGYATLDGQPDPATAFIAAPWTAADGAPFPDGMHYALTHWYADPTDRTTSRADEVGLTRYCAAIDAATVEEWMTDYPLSEAPEGYPDLM